MATLTWEVLDEINLAEEPHPDSDEPLTPQNKHKKRLVTKRERKNLENLENGVMLILQLWQGYKQERIE